MCHAQALCCGQRAQLCTPPHSRMAKSSAQRAEAGARAASNAVQGSLSGSAGALTVGLQNARLAPRLPCTAALSGATHVCSTTAP